MRMRTVLSSVVGMVYGDCRCVARRGTRLDAILLQSDTGNVSAMEKVSTPSTPPTEAKQRRRVFGYSDTAALG